MKSQKTVSGFICAGLLVAATGVSASGIKDGQDTYRNMIDRDSYMQQMVDNRTEDARYRNAVTLDSFVQQLADSRVSEAAYKNIINLAAFEESLADQRVGDGLYRNVITYDTYVGQLEDTFTPPYRNVFSIDRFYVVIGDPCLTEGTITGPILFAQCEVR